MAAVIADPTAGAVLPKRGKKKLIVFAAVGLALAIALAGGAVVYLKHKAAQTAAEAGEEEGASGDDAAVARADPKNAPQYLALDPFVVNLADKDNDRYAQIGVTFELDSGGSMESIKAYMPSIRNAILMVLANKTSRELNDRAGKEDLAREIMREAVRPMGIEIAAPEPITAATEAASAAASASSGAASSVDVPKVKPKAARTAQKNPIQHVHFSSFIIQ